MAAQNQRSDFSPSRASPIPSPTPSAVRSSPLSSRTLGSYPVTTPAFTSSPVLLSTQSQSSSPASPSLFEDLEYSSDMENDFRRIDQQGIEVHGTSFLSQDDGVLVPDTPPPIPQDEKTWVVFCGRLPGVYDNCLSAAMQTQGHKEGFQRFFPTRDSAMAAWSAYNRDKTYPDYGKGPWVVFLGRKPGVFTKVTELECSVRGYAGAVFRCCSSSAEGSVKFQLFAERVNKMFAGSDPFSAVAGMMSQQEGRYRTMPTTRSATPALPTLEQSGPSFTPQVAESSKAAWKHKASGFSSVQPLESLRLSRPGDGWYVAHNAVLPGVYYGMEALRNSKPVPGGFHCALDKASADRLFHDITINGAIVWADDNGQ